VCLSRLGIPIFDEERAAPPSCCETVSTIDNPRIRGEHDRNSSSEGGNKKLGVDEFKGGFDDPNGDGVALFTADEGVGVSGCSAATGNLPSRTYKAS